MVTRVRDRGISGLRFSRVRVSGMRVSGMRVSGMTVSVGVHGVSSSMRGIVRVRCSENGG